MRTITRYRLHAVGLILLLAAGCQATHPTAIIKSPAARATAQGHDWMPQACIVLHASPKDGKAIGDLQSHLKRAAQIARVKFLRDRSLIPPDTDVILDVVRADEPCTSVSSAAVYSDASVGCDVECRDSQDRLLTTLRFSGSAHSSESAVAVGASLLLMIPTLDVSSSVERSAMRSSALGAAMRDLAAQVVNFAADPSRIEQALLDGTHDMDAADITNRGAELFGRQQYSEAEFYLSEAARRFPTYQPAFCYLGACQAQLRQREEARQTLQIAIRLSPDTQEAVQAQQWLRSLNQ